MVASAAAPLPSPPYELGSLPTSQGGCGELPLVVRPRAGRDPAALTDWLTSNPDWVQSNLTRHGAILFRGFAVDDPAAFEGLARSVAPDLKNDYLGTSPRNALTPYVFTASELPPFYPIPQHCEMSFVKAPPSRLFFWAPRPNDGAGGETPLVDVRRMLADLAPDVRDRFRAKGVRIVRNYTGPGSKSGMWQLKRWDEMFLTTDRAVVERKSAEAGFEVVWLPGDRLRLISTQPATAHHPTTGEEIWFNHSQVFHLSAAADEYARIARRPYPLVERLRYLGLAAFAAVTVAARRSIRDRDEHPMHCTFENGDEIADTDMDAVRDAFWKNFAAFAWQKGDVVAIDNYAVAHGRLPYTGPRSIGVAWA